MQPTSYMNDLIDEDLKRGTLTPQQIARRYGVGLNHVVKRLPPEVKKVEVPSTEDGWGREELRPYILTRRHAHDPEWPKSTELEQAKNLYDEGHIEICTGRDGDWFILYAIHRKEVDRSREPYFSRIFGDL